MTPDEMEALRKARRGRNVALGLVLLCLVVLFFAITIVKFGAH
jgi:hypothetical protein